MEKIRKNIGWIFIMVMMFISIMLMVMCFVVKTNKVEDNNLIKLKENAHYTVIEVRETSLSTGNKLIFTINLLLEDENNVRYYVSHSCVNKKNWKDLNFKKDLTYNTWATFSEGDEVISVKEEPSLLLK